LLKTIYEFFRNFTSWKNKKSAQIRVIRVIRVQKLFFFSFLYLFLVFASRPPLGGIDNGAGGFAQGWHTALLGNDREQHLHSLEKLWPLGACKGTQSCRQFFELSSFERKIFVAMLRKNAIL